MKDKNIINALADAAAKAVHAAESNDIAFLRATGMEESEAMAHTLALSLRHLRDLDKNLVETLNEGIRATNKMSRTFMDATKASTARQSQSAAGRDILTTFGLVSLVTLGCYVFSKLRNRKKEHGTFTDLIEQQRAEHTTGKISSR